MATFYLGQVCSAKTAFVNFTCYACVVSILLCSLPVDAKPFSLPVAYLKLLLQVCSASLVKARTGERRDERLCQVCQQLQSHACHALLLAAYAVQSTAETLSIHTA